MDPLTETQSPVGGGDRRGEEVPECLGQAMGESLCLWPKPVHLCKALTLPQWSQTQDAGQPAPPSQGLRWRK